MSDRYITAFHMRDDDRRRWWVIDTRPSAEAKSGTTVAECLGEGRALEVARALNRAADVEAVVDAVTTAGTWLPSVGDRVQLVISDPSNPVGEVMAVHPERMLAEVLWDGDKHRRTHPWRELKIARPDPTRVIREGVNPDEEPF